MSTNAALNKEFRCDQPAEKRPTVGLVARRFSELFKMTTELLGHIVECCAFKGVPLARFAEAAGIQSIAVDQMMTVLNHKKLDQNVELVAGDIPKTVPKYCAEHPKFGFAMTPCYVIKEG